MKLKTIQRKEFSAQDIIDLSVVDIINIDKINKIINRRKIENEMQTLWK